MNANMGVAVKVPGFTASLSVSGLNSCYQKARTNHAAEYGTVIPQQALWNGAAACPRIFILRRSRFPNFALVQRVARSPGHSGSIHCSGFAKTACFGASSSASTRPHVEVLQGIRRKTWAGRARKDDQDQD